MNRNRIRPFVAIVAVTLLCLTSLQAVAWQENTIDEDRYTSLNKVRTVHKPALEAKSPFNVPTRIRRNDLKNVAIIPSEDLRQLIEQDGKDGAVLGPVASVYIPRGGNKVILNFGNDHRVCFKAVIDIRDFFKWGTEDPSKIASLYEGSIVVTDGLISIHQELPQILVTLPHQLKIVTGR
ncbi:MAG TPA: hypothetical protein PKD64_15950 [Pirellulaceae bacterium]|nr:hypothetical protein [Pirellulaceae bacterium]HMO93681.1 hypothetical protein [Pirellulaceae bacterium]HMP68423.1 hypothetical protein [Pirellulaceae bacterium]